MMEIYYFGCWNCQLGHYLSAPGGHRPPYEWRLKWNCLDGGIFLPSTQSVQGLYRLSRVSHVTSAESWTIISWWDRSIDSRPNSCSAFLARGELTADQILALARETFPHVFARMKFTLSPEGVGGV